MMCPSADILRTRGVNVLRILCVRPLWTAPYRLLYTMMNEASGAGNILGQGEQDRERQSRNAI